MCGANLQVVARVHVLLHCGRGAHIFAFAHFLQRIAKPAASDNCPRLQARDQRADRHCRLQSYCCSGNIVTCVDSLTRCGSGV